MKKPCILMLVSICLMCVSGSGDLPAQGIFGNKVADTPHNLRKALNMGVADLGEICVYCHTPHNNNLQIDAPLWNRETPAGPYSMYDSPSIDMIIAGSATGVSLACLSCHDNSIALDQVINLPTSQFGQITLQGGTIAGCASFCHAIHNKTTFEGTVIGTDLSNDHPISITYDPSKDEKFNPATNGVIGILRLYGANKDQVECASCHNPHDNSNRPFLRMANDNSAMCLTCHDI